MTPAARADDAHQVCLLPSEMGLHICPRRGLARYFDKKLGLIPLLPYFSHSADQQKVADEVLALRAPGGHRHRGAHDHGWA